LIYYLNSVNLIILNIKGGIYRFTKEGQSLGILVVPLENGEIVGL
jgi:hypothetical protein